MRYLSLMLLLASCSPPPQVACSGPLPITCECVTACELGDAGIITTPEPLHALAADGCMVRCWNRAQ